MQIARRFSKLTHSKNSLYGQILVVFLAFTMMTVFSYLSVRNVIRSQLMHESRIALDFWQLRIESDLVEPQMLVDTISYSIRNLIMLGHGPELIQEYITQVSARIRDDRQRIRSVSIYGYFEVFGKFLSAEGWHLPADSDPRQRPWFLAAIEANGQTVFTQPYRDIITGGYVISCSRQIFLDDISLGVISIDISFESIIHFITEMSGDDGRYGLLLNDNLIILAHPDISIAGRRLGSLGGDILRLAGYMEQGDEIFGKNMINHFGVDSIVFFRQLNNGWHVGLVIPTRNFFWDIILMRRNITIVSLALAVILSAVLWIITTEKNRLDTENQAKTKFLATVSHEIRTPMNAILGITEIQLQNKSLQEETKEALSKIYNSGNLLLDIINDILDFSKIEAKKLELIPVKYEVKDLINDVAQLNKIRYEDKPVEFKLDISGSIPSSLIGDDLRIKQILNNILSNAFKYTSKGEVSMSVNAEYAARGVSTSMTLVFRISDTGQGMTQEQIYKIFDDYSRFNIESNRTTQGTGLGMSITQNLVQMMDGSISVESVPNKGTTVTVRLPQRNIGFTASGIMGKKTTENLEQFRISSASQAEKIQIARDPMPYGKVLIVDDVETNLYVAKGFMTPYDLSVETASSGFETIEKIKAGNKYDIIFLDHMMPKMDGIETLKKIREMGYNHPVIALTANALVGQEEIFLDSGFDRFISKPIDTRQLNTVLNELIRDKQPYEKIEAARREKAARLAEEEAYASSKDFIRIAKKAKTILEAILKNEFRRDSDKSLYTNTLRILKNALENIGETETADFAEKLERVNWDSDVTALPLETTMFLEALQNISQKFILKESETVIEEQAFLREKLLVIREACEKSDKKTAKETLVELKRKDWPQETKDLLNTVAEHLLQGKFEEAAAIAKERLDAHA